MYRMRVRKVPSSSIFYEMWLAKTINVDHSFIKCYKRQHKINKVNFIFFFLNSFSSGYKQICENEDVTGKKGVVYRATGLK